MANILLVIQPGQAELANHVVHALNRDTARHRVQILRNPADVLTTLATNHELEVSQQTHVVLIDNRAEVPHIKKVAPDVQVILMTDAPIEIDDVTAVGADAWLMTPFSQDRLLSMLTNRFWTQSARMRALDIRLKKCRVDFIPPTTYWSGECLLGTKGCSVNHASNDEDEAMLAATVAASRKP